MKLLRCFRVLPFFVLVALVAAGQQVPATIPVFAWPQQVVLDTDIGDDIDDAFALALLLQSPEVNLLGVTTAYGDTELRAELVDRLLGSIEKRNLPVVPGVPTAQQNNFSQAAYARSKTPYWGPDCPRAVSIMISNQDLAHWDRIAEQKKKDDAAGFLLDQIRANAYRLTLIAIGPLNNIQAAIERDPATFRKLNHVVIMGGSIYRGYDGQQGERRAPDAEWNISRDPAGLRALLASGVPVYMMPLDSTQIHLQTAEREKLFSHGSPLTDQLTLLYHQWLANKGDASPTPTLFDPVAAAFAVHPELCPVTPLHLEVDDKGMTLPTAGAPNAQVCLQSDEKGFLDLLMNRLTGKP